MLETGVFPYNCDFSEIKIFGQPGVGGGPWKYFTEERA